MLKSASYAGWQYVFFWSAWSLLLLPAYCSAFGTWLIGSLLGGYHEPVDIVLTLILFVTLLVIVMLAIYTGWHFVHRTRNFARLMLMIMFGVVIVPLLSTTGAVVSYVQLGDGVVPPGVFGG